MKNCNNIFLKLSFCGLVATDIKKLYEDKDKDDYAEGMVDIFVALAAKALSNFSKAKQSPHLVTGNASDYSRKFVEYLKCADEKKGINEYTWLIKGFFEICQGMPPRQSLLYSYICMLR